MTVLDDTRATKGKRTKVADEAGTAERRGRDGRVTGSRATRSKAAQRAIDRHSKRLDTDDRRSRRSSTKTDTGAGRLRSRTSAPITLRERLIRVPIVVPVLALLALGLGLSLWLSTKAAQDSYDLGVARKENQSLTDQRDALKRAYESGSSAPELSDKAAALGMIPAKNPARMVVGPNGRPRIVGDPSPAAGTRMGTINPENTPDPTAQIDPKKVDDSIGLTGSAATGTPTATPAPSTPAGSTPSGSAPATPSAPAPDPEATVPAPNVLPQNATPTNPTNRDQTQATPTTTGNPPSTDSPASR
ncbi:hypothetical protein [Gordonia sp. NB41Y]|uniref:hypothetical protein n=1 Tax=Gordonia sp. NB41Y TaxID=875808 RepID=UPI0009E7906B|nr:hypothetical protein [Gordonia sp. NB41Y]WLP90396.1 hypothetical protein Q9K23_23270 [Gordonia sp. NB41Y]